MKDNVSTILESKNVTSTFERIDCPHQRCDYFDHLVIYDEDSGAQSALCLDWFKFTQALTTFERSNFWTKFVEWWRKQSNSSTT